jgi:antagonist of KipI
MFLSIIKKGLADTIQDDGRYGFQHLGIQPNGCMDYLSAWMGNYILDNPLSNPILEIHFPASQFQFEETGIICITGANFIPVINEKSIQMHTLVVVHKGDILNFLQPIQGKTAYIAVHGKLKTIEWLGSYAGEKINKGDHYATNTTNTSISHKQLNKEMLSKEAKMEQINKHVFDHQSPIRFIPGPAWDDLAPNSLSKIISDTFSITAQSNRMGFKLQGPLLTLTKPNAYLSSAVTRGSLQLLPNGEIIVLMADHQTIGGYANLGQIILVDLPRFAQMKTGQAFQLSITNLETAQQLYRNLYEQFKD